MKCNAASQQLEDPIRYKYEEIAEQIRQKIVSGEYPAGARIPPIRNLAKLHGTNPQTVGKATAYLVSLGYLVSRQGSGSVASIPRTAASRRTIPMLIDRRRSELLRELDSVYAYHCKDIYLAYMLVAQERDFATEFIVFDEDAQVASQAFLTAIEHADGFVVQGDLPPCYFDILEQRGIPAVLINRNVPENGPANLFSFLMGDDGLVELVNYVVSLGHDRLIFVLSSQFDQGTVYRHRLDVVRNVAMSWRPARPVEITSFVFDPDRAAAGDLEQLIADRYTCAIGFNDISALAFYAQAHQLGLTVPTDLSITGFDDILAARLANPTLTTVRVDRADLVRRALHLIETYRDRTPASQHTYRSPTRLTVRRSVATPTARP